MNRRTLLMTMAAVGCSALGLTATAANEPGRKDVNGLVAHEWGTFTGVVDSSGKLLANYTSVGGDLPPFVDTREKDATRRGPDKARALFFIKGYGVPAFQRMETPVIYFYSEKATDVKVRVDLHNGMLTEFYPPVKEIMPAFGKGPGEPGAGAPATQPTEVYPTSTLDWGQVHIAARNTKGLEPPKIAGGNHYAAARETESNFVVTRDSKGNQHAEKFLFYRGLGNFSLPVTLRVDQNGHFQFGNSGRQPIRTAILIEIDATGGVRFATYRNVRQETEMSFSDSAAKPTPEALCDELTQALVGEGLYEKEARAMVATWRTQWLGEPGTRVLYMVPREVTDELMPLSMTPAPTETVRVLVGRIDVLLPSTEKQLDQLVKGALADQDPSATDIRALHRLGRFRDSALEAAMLRQGTLSNEQRAIVFRSTQNAMQKLSAAK